MKRGRVVAAVCVAGAVLAAPADAGGPRPRTVKVEVGSDFYDPKKVTVRKGDRVRWTWIPSLDLHDVVVKRGPEKFTSPLQSGGTYSKTFRKPGTYKLYCSEHEMDMTVVVKRR